MDAKRSRSLVAASVAGMLAAAGSLVFGGSAQAVPGQGGDNVPCYGVNKCKGTGDCGGAGHSCRGQNECKGTGYIELNRDDCLRIANGSLQQVQDDTNASSMTNPGP